MQHDRLAARELRRPVTRSRALRIPGPYPCIVVTQDDGLGQRKLSDLGQRGGAPPGRKERKIYARCQACVKGALASKSHRPPGWEERRRVTLMAAAHITWLPMHAA